MRKLTFILIFIFSTLIFSAIMPYPVFSNHTNITESEAYKINNAKETEISSNTATTSKILSLEFSDVDVLLPIGTEFELCDIETEQIFSFVRTGGKNHADIEPTSQDEFENISASMEFSWSRRPVIVKLNDSAFLPASLAAYPHGYSKKGTSYGHFCLHFLSSKTDGTNEEDFAHQKAIKNAVSVGKEVLELFD